MGVPDGSPTALSSLTIARDGRGHALGKGIWLCPRFAKTSWAPGHWWAPNGSQRLGASLSFSFRWLLLAEITVPESGRCTGKIYPLRTSNRPLCVRSVLSPPRTPNRAPTEPPCQINARDPNQDDQYQSAFDLFGHRRRPVCDNSNSAGRKRTRQDDVASLASPPSPALPTHSATSVAATSIAARSTVRGCTRP